MELYPRRKTNEEYVQAARELLKRSKWLGLVPGVGAVVQFALYAVLWYLIWSIDGIIIGVSDGVHIGLMLGAMCGLFLVLGAQCIVSAALCFMGRRTERLMIKFHDEVARTRGACNHTSDVIVVTRSETSR